MKKTATFVFQVIVTTMIYTVCLYLWYLLDHGVKEFDWTLIVQGLLFSILYVPFSNWWNKKKGE